MTLLSAGVYVQEQDASTIVPNISNNVAFFAGDFTKGPVDQPYVITKRKELIDVFGLPTNENYNQWFQCSKYLDYANQLIITRGFVENKGSAATDIKQMENIGKANTSVNGSKLVIAFESKNDVLPLQMGDTIVVDDQNLATGKVEHIEIDPNTQNQDYKTILVTLDTKSPTLPDAEYTIFNASQSFYNGHSTAFKTGGNDIDGTFGNSSATNTPRLTEKYTLIKNRDDFDFQLQSNNNFGDNFAIKFFTRTPCDDVFEIAIAKKDDFTDKAQAFDGVSLKGLFQYVPKATEFAIAIKSEEGIETYIVSFDELAVDGNNKSTYVENVINDQSRSVYAVHGKEDDIQSYLFEDKNGKTTSIKPLKVQGGKTPKLLEGAIKEAYTSVEDKEKYEIDVIIANEGHENVALDLADKRKDSIAFVGARYGDCVGKKAGEASQAIIKTVTDTSDVLTKTMFGAYFGNYFRIYDTYNKKFRWINIAGDMAGIRCSVTTSNASWFVSAGMKRGQVRGIDKMAFTPSQEHRDNLYKNSINPVVTFPGTGHLVWGNKTLQPFASAFDRINVRGMFSTIERSMAKAARSQVFSLNDPYTRNAISSMFNPYLGGIKAGRGITDFLVICDESNNTPDVISRNELRCDIYIKPAYAAEFIVLNFVNVGTRNFASVIGA